MRYFNEYLNIFTVKKWSLGVTWVKKAMILTLSCLGAILRNNHWSCPPPSCWYFALIFATKDPARRPFNYLWYLQDFFLRRYNCFAVSSNFTRIVSPTPYDWKGLIVVVRSLSSLGILHGFKNRINQFHKIKGYHNFIIF